MTRKEIAGKASFQFVRFFLFLSRFVPQKASYAFSRFLGSIAVLPDWKRKRIALGNLEIVFPGKTEEQRQAIFKESLVRLLKNFFEICFLASGKWSAEDIQGAASATGLEHLDAAVESGRGALLYSGHFGNFPLMVIWLALQGYPIAAVYKEAKNFPDDFFGTIMSRFNVTPLKYSSDPTLTAALIRSLKEKKIILVQNDQSHPHGSYIDFFGKSVPALAGPALLSRRLGVPVIPAYIIRDENDRHQISILPEMELLDAKDDEDSTVLNTQRQLDWIGEILTTHPTEWLWLHNRWKRAR